MNMLQHNATGTSLPTTTANAYTNLKAESKCSVEKHAVIRDVKLWEKPWSRRIFLVARRTYFIIWLIIIYITLMLSRSRFGRFRGRPVSISTDLTPIPAKDVTIVTAFFDIPSKRPSREYLPWIRRFMSLQDNMIIFTTPDQVELFRKLRKNDRRTHVIGMELNETQVVKDFGGMDFWRRQAALDPEEFIHSKELYIIWNEKGHFIEKAMDVDPFGTEFFAWVDMGYLRDDLLENQRMIRFVPAALLKTKALFLDVRALVNGDEYIGGGFIGGYREGVSTWIKSYYENLSANRDRFLGKDQPWMFQTCVQNPELCLWVQPCNSYGDPWFFMGPFLHGVSSYNTLDHLRHVWRKSSVNKLFRWLVGPKLKDFQF
mmetsp:Transcript_8239/g.12666  ORF Transcript_8239/g.12666 Transcript_8239/m.12666 type:complete len:373 (+) Transcript_8239:98-1216(+)